MTIVKLIASPWLHVLEGLFAIFDLFHVETFRNYLDDLNFSFKTTPVEEVMLYALFFPISLYETTSQQWKSKKLLGKESKNPQR